MIIGISGKIGSGKDTVGKIIQYLDVKIHKKTGNWKINLDSFPSELTQWEIKKFAYKLKQIVALLIGCTIEQLEDQEFKKTYLSSEWNKVESMTPRDMLQLMGTECGRDIIHPNVWVNSLFADYKCLCNNCRAEECNQLPNWIITDVRFPNEAQSIKDRGGIIIRLTRNQVTIVGQINTYKDGTTELIKSSEQIQREHPSETSLDNYQDFNYIINNQGTIEELVEQVKQVLIKEQII